MTVTLTDQDFTKLKALTEQVIKVFGDHWYLIYDKDETEVECRTDYTGTRPFPGAYIPIFLTTQWPDHDPTSPLAEFLAVSVKVVPALLAEMERLREVLTDLTASVEHDRDSSACERREARQQSPADHDEPCPACTLHTALHPMCTDGAPS